MTSRGSHSAAVLQGTAGQSVCAHRTWQLVQGFNVLRACLQVIDSACTRPERARTDLAGAWHKRRALLTGRRRAARLRQVAVDDPGQLALLLLLCVRCRSGAGAAHVQEGQGICGPVHGTS